MLASVTLFSGVFGVTSLLTPELLVNSLFGCLRCAPTGSRERSDRRHTGASPPRYRLGRGAALPGALCDGSGGASARVRRVGVAA